MVFKSKKIITLIAVVAIVLSFLVFLPSAKAACDYDHGGADWTPVSGDPYDLDPSGAIAIAGEHCNVGNFNIPAGTNVYVQTYNGSNYGKLTINGVNATIGGALIATGRGYQGIAGPGAGVAGHNFDAPSSGAAYGGNGGGGSGGGGGNTGGSSYGSITFPNDLGSGSDGGAGGGLVKLNIVNNLTIDGSLLANGDRDSYPYVCNYSLGGGAGGGVYISANNFTGSGVISANGGKSSSSCYGYHGGAGGGGRIAVYYTNKTFSGVIRAYSGDTGNKGGAGTIYQKSVASYLADRNEDGGDFLVDNNNFVGQMTSFTPANYTFNSLSIRNGGYLRIPGGGGITTLDSGTLNILSSTILWIDGSFTANNISNVIISGSLTVSGNTSILGLTNGTGNVTINSGGILTHAFNTNAKVNFIDWNLANLTVNSGGLIDASLKGYSSTTGPGAGGAGHNFDAPSSGAAYGGNGGSGSGGGGGNTGGSSYGSLTSPNELGSGSDGGNGGGLVKLNVANTLIIDGSVLTDGGNGAYYYSCNYSKGGGAGGGVYISANNFTGSGVISANGGKSGNSCYGYHGGSGGGGRVAIYYTSKSFTGALRAYGGDTGNKGGAGTIYQKSVASYLADRNEDGGDLLIDNNGLNGAITPILNVVNNFNNFTLGGNGIFSTIGSMTTSNLTVNGTFFLNTNLSVNPSRNVSFGPSAKMVIGNGATLTHNPNINAKTNFIDWTLDNLTINGGGAINVNGKGYSGGNGIGGGTGGGAGDGSGGGGHGGMGGDGTAGAGGAVNDSTAAPINMGSGGGTSSGGAGGGYVKFTLDSAAINGAISANGADGAVNRGGGAGGSIWLNITNIFSGFAGNITANGGNGNGTGGGGGGGIIYITRNPNSGRLYGWIRALEACKNDNWDGAKCLGVGAGDKAGGWDGWISLNCANSGTCSTNDYGVAFDGENFKGFAWGSDVVGWVEFDPSAGGGVSINNQPPTTNNLTAVPLDMCSVGASYAFQWIFSDSGDTESKFQMQIDNDSDFSSPTVDRVFSGLSNPDGTANSQAVLLAASADAPGADKVSYKTIYYWRVRVWDSHNLASSWNSGSSFTTPVHPYPLVGFTPPDPFLFFENQKVDFLTDPSNAPDNSICYDNDIDGNIITVTCTSWIWDFGDGTLPELPSETDGNTSHVYISTGNFGVKLTVSDSTPAAQGGPFVCSNPVDSKTLKFVQPKWKEVVPQ